MGKPWSTERKARFRAAKAARGEGRINVRISGKKSRVSALRNHSAQIVIDEKELLASFGLSVLKLMRKHR